MRRDPGDRLGVPRAIWLGRRRGCPTDRAGTAFALNLLIAFMPLAILGLAFGNAIKATLFKPVPVAIAFIVGGADHPVGRTAPARSHASNRSRTCAGRCAEDRPGAGLCTDSRHLARGRHHHRRPVLRAFAPARRPSFRSFSRCRCCLPRQPMSCSSTATLFSATTSDLWPSASPPLSCPPSLRSLVAALHQPARLHRLRLVSHCLRRDRADHRLHRSGELDRLRP